MLERARDGANGELVLKIGSKGSERSRRMLRARRWHRRPEQSDKRREAALDSHQGLVERVALGQRTECGCCP